MKVISYGHEMFYQYVNGKISSKKISMANKIAWKRERERERERAISPYFNEGNLWDDWA